MASPETQLVFLKDGEKYSEACVKLRADETPEGRADHDKNLRKDAYWRWEGDLKHAAGNPEALAWYAATATGNAPPLVKCMNYKETVVDGKVVAYGCSNHATTVEDILRLFSPWTNNPAGEEGPFNKKGHIGPPHNEKGANAVYDKGYVSLQKQEWIDFARARYNALKDAGAAPAKKRPPRAAAWETLNARCRVCDANVPARFMRWPIGAADDKFLDIKNAVWKGERLPKAGAGNVCAGFSTTTVDGVKIMHGCCNASIKSGAIFGNRVGFDIDDEGFKSCNVCGVVQTKTAINYAHAVGKFTDDSAQTVEEKHAASQVQNERLCNRDNFRVDIGLDGEKEKEVMNYRAATRKLFCAEHTTFMQGCVACFKCVECECPKLGVESTRKGFVRRLLPEWVKTLECQMGRAYDDELKALIAPTSRDDKSEFVVKLLDAVRVGAAWLAEEHPFLSADHPDGERNLNFLKSTCTTQLNEMMEAPASVCGMHRCKCKASNVEARRKMEAEQREMKPTAVIMNRAKERWRTCLDWFDLLWGAKHSPYLGPEDRGAYKDLLAALLKQPAHLHGVWERAEAGQRRNEREGYFDHKSNPFIWSVVIAMMIQYRKCVRLGEGEFATEVGSDSDASRLMGGRAVQYNDQDFAQGHMGFLSEAEQERWTLRSMCAYAEKHKDDITCKAEMTHSERPLIKMSAPEQAAYRQAMRSSYVRTDDEHTLVVRTPTFLQRDANETIYQWQERHKPALFEFYCTLKTMEKWWEDKDKISENHSFPSFQMPNCFMNMVYFNREAQKNGRGEIIKYLTFEDLDAPDKSVVLKGEAHSKMYALRGSAYEDRELALQHRERKDAQKADPSAFSNGYTKIEPTRERATKPILTKEEREERYVELYGKRPVRKATAAPSLDPLVREVEQERLDGLDAERKRKREEERSLDEQKLREETDEALRNAPAVTLGKRNGKTGKKRKADDEDTPKAIQGRVNARFEAWRKNQEAKRLEKQRLANGGAPKPSEVRRKEKEEQEAAQEAAKKARLKTIQEELAAKYAGW